MPGYLAAEWARGCAERQTVCFSPAFAGPERRSVRTPKRVREFQSNPPGDALAGRCGAAGNHRAAAPGGTCGDPNADTVASCRNKPCPHRPDCAPSPTASKGTSGRRCGGDMLLIQTASDGRQAESPAC